MKPTHPNMTARELRRAQARAQKAHRSKPRKHQHAAVDDQIANNPVAQAALRKRIEGDLQRLRTRAGLLAHLGDDTDTMCDAAGRLIYTVAHAARMHSLHNTPEASILIGAANALADIAASPAALATQRAAIISGLNACERLLPNLHTWSLCAGALEMDNILAHRDFMTGDVAHALDRGQHPAANAEAATGA